MEQSILLQLQNAAVKHACAENKGSVKVDW